MPPNYPDDDEDLQRQRQTAGATPTFSQLQQRGYPRPPPQTYNPYGASYGQPERYGDPRRRPEVDAPHITPYGGGQPGVAQTGGPPVGQPPPRPFEPGGGGGPGPDIGQRPPPDDGSGGGGGGDLNQSTLEAYLYRMLTDPTSTQPYQNMMRRLQSGIDVDAARRGVYHSNIPVSAGAEAGAGLAANMQQEAFNNLRGFNQDYAKLLEILLGLS